MIELRPSEASTLYNGRAQADYSQSGEFLKASGQFAFAANGGAAAWHFFRALLRSPQRKS